MVAPLFNTQRPPAALYISLSNRNQARRSPWRRILSKNGHNCGIVSRTVQKTWGAGRASNPPDLTRGSRNVSSPSADAARGAVPVYWQSDEVSVATALETGVKTEQLVARIRFFAGYTIHRSYIPTMFSFYQKK